MTHWVEKGQGLIDALASAGISKITEDNIVKVFPLNRETDAQLIIDNYDELPDAISNKLIELKSEGLRRINLLFPAIKNWDYLDLVMHQWLSLAAAARNPTAKFNSMINTFTAGTGAIAVVKAMTDINTVKTYDAVNTPSWP